MWLVVPVGIALACALALFRRNCRRGWLAGILAANWLLCFAGVKLIGDAYPVDWFLAMDWLAALAALVASRMIWGRVNLSEIIIGAIYGAEIVCHALQYRAVDPVAMKYAGWFFLRDAAVAQILVFYALWGLHGLSRYVDLPRRRLPRFLAMRFGASQSRR